jgi:hypothetical protein
MRSVGAYTKSWSYLAIAETIRVGAMSASGGRKAEVRGSGHPRSRRSQKSAFAVSERQTLLFRLHVPPLSEECMAEGAQNYGSSSDGSVGHPH